MPQDPASAEARAALMALISATAGTETGAKLCRHLLKEAVDVVAGERHAPAAAAEEQAFSRLARSLTTASEHAEFLAERVAAKRR